jgi:histidinol phosphatase-like PHP family hydrolase
VNLVTQPSAARRELHSLIEEDLNIAAAGLLQDLALIQTNERSRFGYKRAARIIAAALDRPVRELIEEGTLRDVPFLGASTERIVAEVVRGGRSPTVEKALAGYSRRSEVEKRRRYRHAFLSRHTMRRALEAPLGRSVVTPKQFRGDLQMHSTWSDGVESIASMAEAAAALGWSRIGMTDHSYGLPIARGMSMEAAARQGIEIDAVNESFAGRVRVYKGVEANILADGALDINEDERRIFEYVVASPHSLLRRDTDQTARMVNAVRQPGVAILGHPQGRMFNSRPGISADWVTVFREAARQGVAIEIDGNWHRQDIHYELAALANDEGCLFALDSDAHSIGELAFTDYSIAHARIAGVPADRVVNCWDEKKFDDWLAERQGRTPGTPPHEPHKRQRTTKR